MTDEYTKIAEKILAIECGGNGLDELIFFVSTLDDFRPEAIFEWGTNRGGSARSFYEIARALKFKTSITTVENEPDPMYATCIGRRSIKKLIGDGPVLCVQLARPEQRTMFFVDGHHEYKTVQRELDIIYTHCPWAWILVHDTESTEAGLAVTHWPHLHHYNVKNLRSHAGIARLIPK